jgi:cytochrome c biogenesis protein CcmG/thiol:disulfide interchange protein DsbE
VIIFALFGLCCLVDERVAMFRWCLFLLLGAVVVLAAAVMVVEPSRVLAKNEVAEALPAFTLHDGMTGELLGRRDLLGDKFLLNVWATWCVACREEHSFLEVLAEEGVRIVGLYYRDAPASADEWLAAKGNPYVINLLDKRGVLADKLPVRGAPETYFVDRRGIIVYKHSGIVSAENWPQLNKIYLSMP